MPKANLAAEVKSANLFLKADGYRVAIQIRGKRLCLVATLPAKPGSTKCKPHQQRISLKLGATMTGFRRAKAKAILLADQLDRDKFDWTEWIDIHEDEPDVKTCGYWLDKYKAHVWPTLSGDKEYKWKKRFLYFGFNKLPVAEVLTANVLIAAVLTKSETQKATRDRTCIQLQRLADFANIDVDLRHYKMGYSPADVVPKAIPSDLEIETIIDGIKNPQWRYVFALMATYGLRDHEAFLCTLENRDNLLVANVPDETKTGFHLAYPHQAQWVDRWLMKDRTLPNVKIKANQDYGARASSYWRQLKIPDSPYSLRHAYAIRCHAAGVQVAIAASWMGHSPEMHLKTYQRWISEAAHRKAWHQIQQVSN